MMKILAGVEQVNDKTITDTINDQHAHNNNSQENHKSLEEKANGKIREMVSLFLRGSV